MIFVGDDWAEDHHDIALQATGADDIEACRLDHTPEAIAAWLAELAQSELPDDVRARLSAPGVVTPIRLTSAARRLRRLIEEHDG